MARKGESFDELDDFMLTVTCLVCSEVKNQRKMNALDSFHVLVRVAHSK
jgi:hypothetical protein